MESTISAKDQILNSAEALIQTKGFNDFSFREIADLIGIKSASVHHHFKTKEDLGAAVTQRYTDRFISLLTDASDKQSDPKKLLNYYIKLFRQSLVENKNMCLCGMLGAEIESLPNQVSHETKEFFEKNIAWLTYVFKLDNKKSNMKAETKAKTLLALLEGAMIVSRASDNNKHFDDITRKLADNLLSQ